MCAHIDSKTGRAFTKPCANLTTVAGANGIDTYTSDDLVGTDYFQPCPHFSNCGETRTECHEDDFRWCTFLQMSFHRIQLMASG